MAKKQTSQPGFGLDESAAVLRELMAAEVDCKKAELTVETTKAEAKAARDWYDQSVLHLRRLIAECENDANRPLLQEQQE